MTSISVVIPAFNAERFLREAIESVLRQSLAPEEILVVNDGSTDGTAELCRRMGAVTLIDLPHGGVSRARNAGVAAAAGDLIAFLDADDFWLPSKLEKQVQLLELQPEADIAICRQGYSFEGPVPPWFRGPVDGGSEMGTVPSNWLIRRRVWDGVGPFDETLTHGEDTDWWSRAVDAGVRWVLVDELLVVHRIHDANASGNAPAVAEGVLRALRRSVARKRTAQ